MTYNDDQHAYNEAPDLEMLETMAQECGFLLHLLAQELGLIVDYDGNAWGYHFHDPDTDKCLYDDTATTGFTSLSEAVMAGLMSEKTKRRPTLVVHRLALCA